MLKTYYKPLISLLSSKHLDDLPIHVQIRLKRFHFTVSHVPGKDPSTADTLSQSPVRGSDKQFNQKVTAYINMLCENLPAPDHCISIIKQLQLKVKVCQQVIKILQKWMARQATCTYH